MFADEKAVNLKKKMSTNVKKCEIKKILEFKKLHEF